MLGVPLLNKAYWESPKGGKLVFQSDQTLNALPGFKINGEKISLSSVPLQRFAETSGYYLDGQTVCFFLSLKTCSESISASHTYFVAGTFNQWQPDEEWRLAYDESSSAFVLKKPLMMALGEDPLDNGVLFKFVSSQAIWIEPSEKSPNVLVCKNGFRNFNLDPALSGRHWFNFEVTDRDVRPTNAWLEWVDKEGKKNRLEVDPMPLVLNLQSDQRLGAWVTKDKTTIFRIFVPRARRVELFFYKDKNSSEFHRIDLCHNEDGVWSVHYLADLTGYRYGYYVRHHSTSEAGNLPPLSDPYAFALEGPQGPGIILSEKELLPLSDDFKTPEWQDLVIVESHVRDLLHHAPIEISSQERLGFTGLTQWLSSEGLCYLKDLGVNAVELQPINEYDAETKEEYQWGYMPVNYFAPSSNYGSCPRSASQIEEFKTLVHTFHRNGMAVILDVVYNHMGHLNPLFAIDKGYYCRTDFTGTLTNWSGCGNDLRTEAPMVERLIIDSLLHWIRVYHIDGFRFDLAELLGMDVLRRIENALKKEKADVVLIAEPWSFRGHNAYALKETGYASWNDGYRDFLTNYVCGKGNWEGIRYFLSGSLAHLSRFPAQSVNYTESHDDRCWIDKITERADKNGNHFTWQDRRRTHCMFAALLMSLGIPMLAAGQDFLKSKQGVQNTYRLGALNALDYVRNEMFSGTSDYVRTLIRLRFSKLGRLLRLRERPSEHYLRFLFAHNLSSVLALYNADFSLGQEQLLLAINPHDCQTEWETKDIDEKTFVQIFDTERAHLKGLTAPQTYWNKGYLRLPPLSCAIWQHEAL